MQRRMQLIVAAVLTLAMVGSAVWYAIDRRPTPPVPGTPIIGGGEAELSLVALQSDRTGVDPETSFKLTSAKPLELAEVQRAVITSPTVPLLVEQAATSSREFTIKPARALEANKIYRIKLAPLAGVSRAYQWSFQTRATFQVLGSLPRDKGADVPLTTGIEITFSHENYGDVAPYFSISPKVSGRFERHKKTVAFVPETPLQPGTIYTVTLKRGLPQEGTDVRLSEDFAFAFETESESAGKPVKWVMDVPDRMLEFAAGESPFVQMYLDRAASRTIGVTLFRYKDAASFAGALAEAEKLPPWARWNRSRYLEDTSALTRVSAFTAEAQEYENTGTFVHFPEVLPAGFYLAELKHEDQTRQVRLQVTDLATYAAQTATGTLVWLNDLQTGKPVSGAKVSYLSGGQGTGTADADGVAVLPAPPAAADGTWPVTFLQARAGEKESVVVLASETWYYYGWSQAGSAQLYWRYLYLDRQLYKPNDRVNLFGILRPREPGAEPVTAVKATVLRSEYRGPDDKPLPLAEVTLPVRDGTFTGSIDLPGLKPGWYEAAVYMGDEVIRSRYFEVQTYTKPAYQVDVKASRRAVFDGEPVTYTAKATFFEGTPVPGLTLDTGKETGPITTGPDGTVSVTITERSPGDYSPNYHWFSIRSVLPEAGEISASTTVMVFGRDMNLGGEVKVNDAGQAVVTGQVNRITLDRLNASPDAWDYIGDPVPDQIIHGTLIEERWIKEEVGTYYDFIQKQVVKSYYYRPDDQEVGTFTAITDAGGRFHHALAIDKDKSYRVVLRTGDSKGRNVGIERWFTGRSFRAFSDTFYGWYHLQPLTEERWTWQIGEPVTLEMRQDRAALPDRAGGFLFYTARLGLREHHVQDSPRFTYALEEQDLPGTNVFAVNFDGRQYRSAVDYSLRVDPKEKEMRVAVTVDKESYRPGETVTVHVETRNKAGRPVQAAVNLNLVDEALYALMDQQVNLPQDLYGEWVWSGVIRTRASHAVPRPGSGAEKGGDGGGARKDFKDAVFFETVTTDGNGRAVASFKVPDNLTTWRLTWQAVVPGTMEVASGTTGVKVSLPFFVETVLAETYLTGDQPVFTARTYGTALNTGYAVSLAAWLEGPVALARKNAPSTAFQLLGFALPVLSKPGTYQATMEAIGPDGLKDAVQKEFTVVDSYLRQKQVTFDLLEPGARLKQTGDSLVRLAFSDHDRGRYLRLLQQMRWQWGNRFEQKLARMTANDLLTRYFADARGWWGEEPDLDTFAYQTPDGGVSILPYADSDLYLTVLAADLKPDGFDQVTMEEYFQRILDDDGQGRERKVLALYGMAAIGRPVLTAAQELLAAKDLSLQEQLYLALTLAELGDLEGARPYYRAVISQHGEALGPAARIRTGRDQDEILSNTALAGVAAAKLNEPEGPALASYLMENHTAEILLVLEQTLMAAEALPQLPQSPVSFTMLLDGQTVTKELKPGQVLPMTVTQAQARSLQITAVTGKVGLTVTTEGPATRADLTQQEGFHVERTYQAVGGAAGTQFNMGDLVRITLYATIPGTAPGGAYELADYLPAGLRIVQRPWESGIKFTTPGDPSWPLEVNGQRVSFWVGKEPKYPITYYARVVSPGDFTAEEPVLQHQRSGVIYGHGERQKVHIE